MKFDRESILGILICLYLTRSGRTNMKNIADNLSYSQDFLQKIAAKLRKKKIVASKKGPKGGYELVGNPTILSIVQAVKGYHFVTLRQRTELSFGEFEQRAINALFSHLTSTVQITIFELRDLQALFEKSLLNEASEVNN